MPKYPVLGGNVSLSCVIEVDQDLIKDGISINWESPNDQCSSKRMECDKENGITQVIEEDGNVKTYVISR